MSIIAVGIECPFNATKEPYTIMNHGDIYLGLCLDQISQKETEAFQLGEWWFSLRQEQGYLVFVAKNKSNDSNPLEQIFEFVFSLNQVNKEHWDSFLSVEDERTYPIHIILIEKNVNIVKALRVFGLSNRANQFMKGIFLEQTKLQKKTFDTTRLPDNIKKSFNIGFIKEKARTK